MQKINYKIFGIGLPKTGTISLNVALKKLGVDSIHYPIADVIPGLEEGRYEVLSSRRGFTNCGEWHFAALDREFPTAKFVYTIRPLNDWLKSIKRHYETYPAEERGSADYINRVEVFGTSVYDPDIMETIYWAHKGAVDRHFNGKLNLLTLDVSEENALSKLCRFLNVPVPEWKFPHENRWDQRDVLVRQRTRTIRSFVKEGLRRGLRIIGLEVSRTRRWYREGGWFLHFRQSSLNGSKRSMTISTAVSILNISPISVSDRRNLGTGSLDPPN